MNQHASHRPLRPDVRACIDAEAAPADRAELEEAWQLAEHGRPAFTPADRSRKAAAWAALEASLEATPAPASDRTAHPSRPRPAGPGRRREHAAAHRAARPLRTRAVRWMATTALVALLAVVGIDQYLGQPVTLTAPQGARLTATLPDGSQVNLNSGSTLTYTRGFSDETRTVALDGEGFFEVVEDGRPFRVETFNARTTVLGTSFNVRARRDDPTATTSVVVATGRVRLASLDGDDEGVVLTPELGAAVADGASTPTAPDSVSVGRALAWRTGGLGFTDQSVAVILKEIERRYDVTIEAAPSVLVRTSGYYKHEPGTVEAVLADFTMAAELRYRATANGYEVYAPAP